jgi:hypothetical protein
MNYNKYVAFGIASGAIRVTRPFADMRRASNEFFREYPSADVCTIRRVAVKFNGETVNDPDFGVRRVSKQTA